LASRFENQAHLPSDLSTVEATVGSKLLPPTTIRPLFRATSTIAKSSTARFWCCGDRDYVRQDQPARVQGPIVPSSNHQLQLPFTEQIRRYLRRRHFSHTNHISISHNTPTSAIYTESLVLLGAASARETTGPVGHALDCLWQVCLFHACVVACANHQQILSLSIGRPPKIMQSTMAMISLGMLSYVTPLRITRERPQGSRSGQGGLPLATAANCSLPKKVSMTNTLLEVRFETL
jgi:hypothetical protein